MRNQPFVLYNLYPEQLREHLTALFAPNGSLSWQGKWQAPFTSEHAEPRHQKRLGTGTFERRNLSQTVYNGHYLRLAGTLPAVIMPANVCSDG